MTMTSGKPGAFETVRYEVDGPVCTITLDRPDSANAQNTQLIDELDAAFDRADADDEVRVVVLAGEGKHFSAGHDLKELLTNGDDWAKLRDTPEGKLRHEQVMYFDRCVKIRDFRKPTIAAVQGACAAAGLMLACMCDLIVAHAREHEAGGRARALHGGDRRFAEVADLHAAVEVHDLLVPELPFGRVAQLRPVVAVGEELLE